MKQITRSKNIRRGGQSSSDNTGKVKSAEDKRVGILRGCTTWGKRTDKVMKAFKKLDVNVGICNKAAIVKRVSNDHPETRERRTNVESTRSTGDNVIVSTLGKVNGNSETGWKNTHNPRQKGMTNYCLKNTEMMRDFFEAAEQTFEASE